MVCRRRAERCRWARRGAAYPAAGTTSTRRTTRLAAIVLGVAVVAAGVWYATQRAGVQSADIVTHRVAVVPFENLTGDKMLDVVGRVASEELSRSIAQTDSADVVDGNAVLMALGETAQSSEGMVAHVSKATGAGIVVRGSYAKAGDSLRMQVSVIDGLPDIHRGKGESTELGQRRGLAIRRRGAGV